MGCQEVIVVLCPSFALALCSTIASVSGGRGRSIQPLSHMSRGRVVLGHTLNPGVTNWLPVDYESLRFYFV